MPCQLLIHAKDKPNGNQKGEPQRVVDNGELETHPWGNKEGPPDFVILEITDRAAHQIEPYLAQVTNALTYEIVASNAAGRRYRLEVNASVAADVPAKAVGLEMIDYLQNVYSATLHSHDTANKQWVQINIPNTDWSALRDDLKDKFFDTVKARRYVFSDSQVDFILGQPGGMYSTTFATVAANVMDRYPD